MNRLSYILAVSFILSLPSSVAASVCPGPTILIADPGHGGPGASDSTNGLGYNGGNGTVGPNGLADRELDLLCGRSICGRNGDFLN